MAKRVDEQIAPWEDDSSATVAIDPTEPAPLSEFDEFASPDPWDATEDDVPLAPEKEPLVDEIASEFVGFWNALVSKTNWEKGKVIHSWRVKLIDAGVPRRIYSDEAIAKRIGNVSPQHVGRLRRVYERFGESEPSAELYWSHYQAALDWEDADVWLKKAAEEKLSVAQMRIDRWEKTGAKLSHKPKEEDIVDSERDEDVNPRNDSNSTSFDSDDSVSGKEAILAGDDDSKKKSKKKKGAKNDQNAPLGEFAGDAEPWEASAETFRTPEVLEAISKLDPLPDDLADAFETLKVAILSHKLAGWDDVQPVQIAAYFSEFKRLLVSEEK
ncbi:MAG: hypothetical protein IJM30_07085 [Thermoguttaceae bacterium]|nr:hypothetical protein [Thermoguttaceae bacterium]